MAKDRDSALRKLKKMAAKLESLKELNSEAEAQSFAEMMQKLATEHQIDLEDVAEEERETADPLDRVMPDYAAHGIQSRRRHVDWMYDLAKPVAQSHYCVLLVIRSSSAVLFAGRRSQATAAAEVYLKLLMVAENLADKEYVRYFYECKAHGDVTRARGFRGSFLMGFCNRVGARYFEYREALLQYYAHDRKALVVINRGSKEARDWIEAQKLPKSSIPEPKRPQNAAGWRRGHDMAGEVDLSGHKKIG